MADFPSPLTQDYGSKAFDGQNTYFNNNKVVISGQEHEIIGVGHACGGIDGPPGNAVTIFDGPVGVGIILTDPPYCNVCATCMHPCGTSTCPDYITCGIPVDGGYGWMVTFPSVGWVYTCLSKIGFVPAG